MKKDIELPLVKGDLQQQKNESSYTPSSPSINTRFFRMAQLQTARDCHIYDIPDLMNTSNKAMLKLLKITAICFTFFLAELVGGLFAHSLAILSDAAHLFSDLSGFFISIFSIWIAKKPSNQMMSYGYHRAEVLGALASIIIIWCLTLILLYEATERIIIKSVVQVPQIMLVTAFFGLICNLVMAKVLFEDQGDQHEQPQIEDDCSQHSYNDRPAAPQNEKKEEKESNYNVKAAMIHILGDLIQSIGVIIAASIICVYGQVYDDDGNMTFTPYQYADPICTYLFSILVMGTTFGVARECMKVLMEGTPSDVDTQDFEQKLKTLDYVKAIHDLHVWCLSPGKIAMSVHIICDDNKQDQVLDDATKLCKKFGIYHSTIQTEIKKSKN